MLSGLPLLLAALISAPSRPPLSTPETNGVCDEASAEGDSDGSEVPPLDTEPGDEPLTPSVNCSEPPPVPSVVDCNDSRMSVWVQEMIGTCDMPRTTFGAAARPAKERPSALCSGSACTHDSSPIRAATRDVDPQQSISASSLRILVFLDAAPLDGAAEHRPRQALPGRLERPPRF